VTAAQQEFFADISVNASLMLVLVELARFLRSGTGPETAR
jgi:hypothetical protein